MTILTTSDHHRATLIFSSAVYQYGAVSGLSYETVLPFVDQMLALRQVWTALRPFVSSQITLASIEIKQGPSSTGPTYTEAIGEAGQVNQAACSPNTSYLLRFHPLGWSGKYGGRMYLPGISEEQQQPNGDVLPATVTALNAVLTTQRVTLAAAGMPLRIFPADGESPVKEVSAWTCEARTATQRRRLRR